MHTFGISLGADIDGWLLLCRILTEMRRDGPHHSLEAADGTLPPIIHAIPDYPALRQPASMVALCSAFERRVPSQH
jgi:hypothetical protein